MNVKLVNYTPNALDLLLKTKNTRMGFDSDPATWTEAQREEHLAYMKDTIKSSWEFVDYVFEFTGVTRAFTQQLERTRTGAYAEQSMRATDVREAPVMVPEHLIDAHRSKFEQAAWATIAAYGSLIDDGVPIQDARGLLPMNTTTSLMAKFDLRTLHNMALVRLCTRTQGEYQQRFREMRDAVIAVHPWVEEFGFLEVGCVSTGACVFPRYGAKQCKFYQPWMDNRVLQATLKREFWGATIQEANPVAKEGKAV